MEQESTQVEATVEKPKEEISKETPQVFPEKKETSEKARTEVEFRKMQSMKDSAEATLRTVQTELQGLRKQTEQQRGEARRKEIADLDGDADGQGAVRRKHRLEDDLRNLEEQKIDAESAVQRKYDQAADLSKQYNLSLADARELLDASTPKEMELMAQIKVAEQAKGQVESLVPSGFKPDSGTSDVGGDDDETFVKNYSEGKSDDHKRAQKILNKT